MEILEGLPDVAEVKAEDHVFRIASHNGSRTTVALMDAARSVDMAIASLSVQSTTLDDVFVHLHRQAVARCAAGAHAATRARSCSTKRS